MTVLLIATGGTIASRRTDQGARVALSGADLLQQCAATTAAPLDDVEVLDISYGPSWSFQPDQVIDIARSALEAAPFYDGVVVTHGTDTLEETAWLTWLLSGDRVSRPPIVFTGAMRTADDPEADGPANLTGALDAARGMPYFDGPFVWFNGEAHHPRRVTKMHTTSTNTFRSVGGRDAPAPPTTGPDVKVETAIAQVQSHIGVSDALVHHLLDTGTRGLVVEGSGAGNVNGALVPGIERALDLRVPVVVTSRSPGGRVHPTYGGEGGGWWLAQRGVLNGGDLQSHKARWALGVALGVDPSPAAVHEWMRAVVG